jgi:hypothetical protein
MLNPQVQRRVFVVRRTSGRQVSPVPDEDRGAVIVRRTVPVVAIGFPQCK